MHILKNFSKDLVGMCSSIIILFLVILGLMAPVIAPHDPNLVSIFNKLEPPSWHYLLGTDHLGRCILSRLIFGVQTTFFYAAISMFVTIALGTIFGMLAGFSQGFLRELILRFCDTMLSFPSEVMILAVIGILGPGLANIIVANILAKMAWYTRMIYSTAQQYQNRNYVKFAQIHSRSKYYLLKTHLFSGIRSEVITHASLEMGWVILSISTLSFLGLGVQAPTAEWGMMLSEARNVMFSHPWQMIPPGLVILVSICALNFLGDSLQQAMKPKLMAKKSFLKRRNQTHVFTNDQKSIHN